MSVLRVPIRVDGLYVGSDGQEVTLPMADFSQLPYNLCDGSTVNRSHPNLAEEAFNSSLGSGKSRSVPRGLHLHWALPDALTVGHYLSGSNGTGSTQFPAVPNRWLVRRLDDAGSLQKAWVVESDYLHPLDDNKRPTKLQPPSDPQSGKPITSWPGDQPITFPTKRLQLQNGKLGAAFRYMGRSLLLGEWLAEDETDYEYLNQAENSSYPLTAIGYGEPAFAAYYPNCYSVFGFCDVDEGLNPDGNYEYQVIGWYNEPSLDPLRSPHLAGLSSDAERYDALKSEYGWVLTDADRQEAFPQRTVCYASLVLSPHDAGPWASGGDVDISIANTGGEALAALLADKAASGQNQDALKRQIEDQLEAVLECLADPGVQDPGSKSDLGKRLGGARNRARWINSRISEFVGLLQNLFNANLTLVSVKQSDQTRRISAWAAIIASIYGMNFRYMPELGWRFGYPLALLAMVAICIVLYVVFKRIGWL